MRWAAVNQAKLNSIEAVTFKEDQLWQRTAPTLHMISYFGGRTLGKYGQRTTLSWNFKSAISRESYRMQNLSSQLCSSYRAQRPLKILDFTARQSASTEMVWGWVESFCVLIHKEKYPSMVQTWVNSSLHYVLCIRCTQLQPTSYIGKCLLWYNVVNARLFSTTSNRSLVEKISLHYNSNQRKALPTPISRIFKNPLYFKSVARLGHETNPERK